MFMPGQIVIDLDNEQLVMFLGLFWYGETEADEKLFSLYGTEEQIPNLPSEFFSPEYFPSEDFFNTSCLKGIRTIDLRIRDEQQYGYPKTFKDALEAIARQKDYRVHKYEDGKEEPQVLSVKVEKGKLVFKETEKTEKGCVNMSHTNTETTEKAYKNAAIAQQRDTVAILTAVGMDDETKVAMIFKSIEDGERFMDELFASNDAELLREKETVNGVIVYHVSLDYKVKENEEQDEEDWDEDEDGESYPHPIHAQIFEYYYNDDVTIEKYELSEVQFKQQFAEWSPE